MELLNNQNQKSNNNKIILPGNLLRETEQMLKKPELRLLELEQESEIFLNALIKICDIVSASLMAVIGELSKNNYDYESKYKILNDWLNSDPKLNKDVNKVFSEDVPEHIKAIPMHIKRLFYLNVLMYTAQGLIQPVNVNQDNNNNGGIDKK